MKFNITRVSDLKKVDTDVFNRLMDEYRQALDDLCEGRLTDDDITEYLTIIYHIIVQNAICNLHKNRFIFF